MPETVFSEVLNTSVKRDQLRTMLTDFVYALMQQSQLFIRIVASYKLTDRDIMACIKVFLRFFSCRNALWRSLTVILKMPDTR